MSIPREIIRILDRLNTIQEQLKEIKDDKETETEELNNNNLLTETKAESLEFQHDVLEDALISIEEAISLLNDYA